MSRHFRLLAVLAGSDARTAAAVEAPTHRDWNSSPAPLNNLPSHTSGAHAHACTSWHTAIWNAFFRPPLAAACPNWTLPPRRRIAPTVVSGATMPAAVASPSIASAAVTRICAARMLFPLQTQSLSLRSDRPRRNVAEWSQRTGEQVCSKGTDSPTGAETRRLVRNFPRTLGVSERLRLRSIFPFRFRETIGRSVSKFRERGRKFAVWFKKYHAYAGRRGLPGMPRTVPRCSSNRHHHRCTAIWTKFVSADSPGTQATRS